jgi:glycosyltransferase involved in cell wall biosynthesis
MRILFNTRNKEGVASELYARTLCSLPNIHFYRWDSYKDFDVALFMAYERDLKDIETARRENPNLKIGLIDPRRSIKADTIDCVDFIVIDSIEMRDFFAKYQRPMFTYYEYTNLKVANKTHYQKDKIIIGYHGNKVHLMEMYPRITEALELLGDKYKLELWAMYNIEKLGKWKLGIPRNIPVRHIQWSLDNYYEYLTKADVGIVPALMPIRNIGKMKNKTTVSKRFFLDDENDYLIKFKMPSNPGRIITFAQLGIPVVADMSPSCMQFIEDGANGFIAYSTAGWYSALEKLIQSPDLRQKFSESLYGKISSIVNYDLQNQSFIEFLKLVTHNSAVNSAGTIVNSDEYIGKELDYRKQLWRCIVSTRIEGLKRRIRKPCLSK